MPSKTIGVAGQGIPNSVRGRAVRPIGRAIFIMGASILAGCLAASAQAAEPTKAIEPTRTGAAANSAGAPATKVAVAPAELFEAIKRGDVEAKVIVRDQYHARVILRNKTAAPVALRLPDTFAARPVLAQQNFPFPTSNQSPRQTQPQAVSGSMGSQNGNQGFISGGQNQGGQNQNFFGNNNIFNIAPESVRSMSISCFCVELGKPNPRSIHPYELVTFEEVGGDPTLAAVFERYSRGDLDREAVQAAVWHLANEKSWDELGKLSRKIALNAEEPIFSRQQLRLARDLVAFAAGRAAEQPAAVSSAKAPGIAEAADKPGSPAADAGRSIPASAEKYRTIRALNARR